MGTALVPCKQPTPNIHCFDPSYTGAVKQDFTGIKGSHSQSLIPESGKIYLEHAGPVRATALPATAVSKAKRSPERGFPLAAASNNYAFHAHRDPACRRPGNSRQGQGQAQPGHCPTPSYSSPSHVLHPKLETPTGDNKLLGFLPRTTRHTTQPPPPPKVKKLLSLPTSCQDSTVPLEHTLDLCEWACLGPHRCNTNPPPPWDSGIVDKNLTGLNLNVASRTCTDPPPWTRPPRPPPDCRDQADLWPLTASHSRGSGGRRRFLHSSGKQPGHIRHYPASQDQGSCSPPHSLFVVPKPAEAESRGSPSVCLQSYQSLKVAWILGSAVCSTPVRIEGPQKLCHSSLPPAPLRTSPDTH